MSYRDTLTAAEGRAHTAQVVPFWASKVGRASYEGVARDLRRLAATLVDVLADRYEAVALAVDLDVLADRVEAGWMHQGVVGAALDHAQRLLWAAVEPSL